MGGADSWRRRRWLARQGKEDEDADAEEVARPRHAPWSR
jgi:hypothetical protein